VTVRQAVIRSCRDPRFVQIGPLDDDRRNMFRTPIGTRQVAPIVVEWDDRSTEPRIAA
jgi:hypothetical protein